MTTGCGSSNNSSSCRSINGGNSNLEHCCIREVKNGSTVNLATRKINCRNDNTVDIIYSMYFLFGSSWWPHVSQGLSKVYTSCSIKYVGGNLLNNTISNL